MYLHDSGVIGFVAQRVIDDVDRVLPTRYDRTRHWEAAYRRRRPTAASRHPDRPGGT